MNGITTAADKILEQVLSDDQYGFKDQAGTTYILDVNGPAADSLSASFNALVKICSGVQPHEAHVDYHMFSNICTASNGDQTQFDISSSSGRVNADGQCMISTAQQVMDNSGLNCHAVSSGLNVGLALLAAAAGLAIIITCLCIVGAAAERRRIAMAMSNNAELTAPLFPEGDNGRGSARSEVSSISASSAAETGSLLHTDPFQTSDSADPTTEYEAALVLQSEVTPFKFGGESTVGKEAFFAVNNMAAW
ncbi:MAG: hypothetical protein Q7V63_05450 [Gammaproteobacteria bacterium]|nr:hypothetical protein [Gammaproteobacteria bacterium]